MSRALKVCKRDRGEDFSHISKSLGVGKSRLLFSWVSVKIRAAGIKPLDAKLKELKTDRKFDELFASQHSSSRDVPQLSALNPYLPEYF